MKVGEQAVYLARLKGVSRHDAIQQLKAWFEKFGIEAMVGSESRRIIQRNGPKR